MCVQAQKTVLFQSVKNFLCKKTHKSNILDRFFFVELTQFLVTQNLSFDVRITSMIGKLHRIDCINFKAKQLVEVENENLFLFALLPYRYDLRFKC